MVDVLEYFCTAKVVQIGVTMKKALSAFALASALVLGGTTAGFAAVPSDSSSVSVTSGTKAHAGKKAGSKAGSKANKGKHAAEKAKGQNKSKKAAKQATA
jgi:hypothetical protein